jgi:hypothetical protein
MAIVSISEARIVNGCLGHSTLLFKRPIVEGRYYLEFKILKPSLPETSSALKSPPSLRFGICPPDYPKNSPLGQNASLAYKMSNGNLVLAGIEHPGGPSLSPGDVIGLAMSFSPPDKTQDPTALWEDC